MKCPSTHPSPPITRRARANLFRYFVHSKLSQTAGPAYQIQLYNTVVAGSMNHLLSTTRRTDKLVAAIDDINTLFASFALYASTKDSAGRALNIADLRITPAEGIIAREHERLRMTLTHSPFCDSNLASRTFHALNTPRECGTSSGQPARMQSWLYHYKKDADKRARMGIPAPVPADVWDISRLASNTGRLVAYKLWVANIKKNATKSLLKYGVHTAPSWVPRASPPSVFLMDLLNLGSDPTLDAAHLGEHKGYTPLDVTGPGCSGSILALSTLPMRYSIVINRARLGRLGLLRDPLWAVHWSAKEMINEHRDAVHAARLDGDEDPEARAPPNRFHVAFKFTDCDLCGDPNGDAIHFVTTCHHAGMTARRELALANVKHVALDLLHLLHTAHTPRGAYTGYDYTNSAAFRTHVDNLDMASNEGRFLVSRLITCSTWSNDVCPDTWLLARAFSALFAKPLGHSRLRRLANFWVAWANSTITATCVNWHVLLTADAAKRLADGGLSHELARRPRRRRAT